MWDVTCLAPGQEPVPLPRGSSGQSRYLQEAAQGRRGSSARGCLLGTRTSSSEWRPQCSSPSTCVEGASATPGSLRGASRALARQGASGAPARGRRTHRPDDTVQAAHLLVGAGGQGLAGQLLGEVGLGRAVPRAVLLGGRGSFHLSQATALQVWKEDKSTLLSVLLPQGFSAFLGPMELMTNHQDTG